MCHEREAFLGRMRKEVSPLCALGSSIERGENRETRSGFPRSREDSRNRRVNFPVSICETAARWLFRVINTNVRLVRYARNAFFPANLKIPPSVREAFSASRRERPSVTPAFEMQKRDCWHTPPNSLRAFFQASSSTFEPPHFFARTARLPSRGRLGKGRASTGRSDRSDPESPSGEVRGVERVTRGSLGAFASRSRFF